MLKVFKIIRLNDWWLNIIPRYLGFLYILVFYYELPFPFGVTSLFLFLSILIFTASFAYLLNEITDLNDDLAAGKKNSTASLSQVFRLFYLLLFGVLSFLPWVFLPVNKLSFSLFIVQFALLVLYSVKPFRLKRFPITGVILDAFYNNVVMLFVIITFFDGLDAKNNQVNWLFMVVIFAWAFLKGLRGILVHQVVDRKNDKKTSDNTFVLKYGPLCAINLTSKCIVPSELLFFIAIILPLSVIKFPFLWLVVPLFYSYLFFFFRLWEKNTLWRLREEKFRYLYIFNDLYEEWIPIIALLYLPFLNLWYVILIPLHLLLFNGIGKKLIRNFKKNLKNYEDFRKFRKQKKSEIFHPREHLFHVFISHLKVAHLPGSLKRMLRYLPLLLSRIRNQLTYPFLETRPGRKIAESMDKKLIREYNRQRYWGPQPVICYAPFKSLYFGSDGHITSCCFNREHILGAYPNDDLNAIWKGLEIEILRDCLVNNDFRLGCFHCENWIKSRNFSAVGAMLYDKYKRNERFPIKLEFELSNNCNLECIMCSSFFSSAIAKTTEKLPPRQMPYDDRFVIQLEKFIPHLKEAKFMGGEPFLINIYYKIWARIIELNPGCLIDLQTNGTLMNSRIREVLDRGCFQIGVSIDSLKKETYEQIRKNARFEDVMSNLRYFADYCEKKGTVFHISVCPMKINWRELPDMIEYCNSSNLMISFNTVYQPPLYALWNLSSSELNEIYKSLKNHKLNVKGIYFERNKNHFHAFINQINAWRIKSSEREKVELEPVSDDIKNMKHELYYKIREYISNKNDPDVDIDALTYKYTSKLDSVISLFPESFLLKISLKQLSEYPVEKIVDEVNNKSVEDLYCMVFDLMAEIEKVRNEYWQTVK